MISTGLASDAAIKLRRADMKPKIANFGKSNSRIRVGCFCLILLGGFVAAFVDITAPAPYVVTLESAANSSSSPRVALWNHGQNPVFFTGNSTGSPQLVIEYNSSNGWKTIEPKGFSSESVPLRPGAGTYTSLLIPPGTERWRVGAELWEPSGLFASLSRLSARNVPAKVRELSFKLSGPKRRILWSPIMTNRDVTVR